MIRKFIFLCVLCVSAVNSSFAHVNRSALIRANRELPARTKYEINVEIQPEIRAYKGTEKVIFANRQKKPTGYLLFFLYPNDPSLTKSDKKYLSISNVKVNGSSARVEEPGPFLKVFLGKELYLGQSVTVEFDFMATLPAQKENKDLFSETMDELMRMLNSGSATQQDYGLFSSTKDIVNLGLWYAALSKYDVEGWDEEKYSGLGDVSYFDPSDFTVNIVAPSQFDVVTTGTALKRVPDKDGKTRHSIESVLSRDFEVELSARYEQKTRIANTTTIRSYYLPEHSESGDLASDAAVRAFEYYERTFGSYPYSELDVVEAPLFGGAGGVEFPGLVTISSMLYKDSSEDAKADPLKQLLANSGSFDQLLEFVVAHEVAHQWWNAVVGSNSKKHPFVDEAMANYSAILYFESTYGREAALQQMAMQMKVNYQLHRLLGGPDRPVQLPAAAFKGPLEYSAIVYGKGALYFDRLRDLMGDSSFFAAMKAYYDSFWFRIATPEDFTKVAKRHAPAKQQEIDALYRHWMLEMHGDEDIGPGTFDALLKTVMAGNPGIPTDNADQLLKQLEEFLKQ